MMITNKSSLSKSQAAFINTVDVNIVNLHLLKSMENAPFPTVKSLNKPKQKLISVTLVSPADTHSSSTLRVHAKFNTAQSMSKTSAFSVKLDII
jgi:hypothetical protein